MKVEKKRVAFLAKRSSRYSNNSSTSAKDLPQELKRQTEIWTKTHAQHTWVFAERSHSLSSS